MQYDKHKAARKIFDDIDKNPQKYLIIHYSCESFYDITDGHTPRITSIAVYDYFSGQTESFSMHKVAEKEKCTDAIQHQYDSLERKMLDEFFAYVKEHASFIWIHWSMRDINYGFKAIEHRYCVLGGEPYKIQDQQKIDLSRELVNCYGAGYIDHPRMEKLLNYNDIRVKDFLTGQQEAEAFQNGEYVKLHMSTLRKVLAFAEILDKAINDTLKVKGKWYEKYGLSFQGVYNWSKERWWVQLILGILILVLGAYLGKWV